MPTLIPKNLIALTLTVVLGLVPPALAGTYLSSAHGNGTSGVQRSTMTSFAVGNCAHCHEEHASVGGSEPEPANGPAAYAGFASEETLCLGCHGGTTNYNSNGNPDNVNTDTTKARGHGTGTTLAVMATAGRHRANETSVTGVSTSAHVECTDCHSPHAARKGNHTASATYKTATGNLIDTTTGSPLEGVSGVSFATYPSTWGVNAVSWGAAAGANSYATATMEYQICFKCHSSANGNVDDWDGNPGGAGEFTDTALEFNPANASYHPITQASPHPLASAQLAAGWAPGDTMYCSDCHTSDSAIAGPHGSATKWLLTGTYTNWPFVSAGDNGSSSAVTFAYNNGPDTSTTFCHNCHPIGNTNDVHDRVEHKGSPVGRCTNCHIRVPHGGKGQRLINANFGGTMPARYTPDGNGGGYGNYGPILKFLRTTYTSYIKENCRASGSGCGDHNSQNPGTTEYW